MATRAGGELEDHHAQSRDPWREPGPRADVRRLARGGTVILCTLSLAIIGWHCLDLHGNLAATAVISCQNDSVARG